MVIPTYFVPIIGIGLSVSVYNHYIPNYSKNFLEVKKQIESKPLPLKEPEQVGSGEKESETDEPKEPSETNIAEKIKLQSDVSDELNQIVKQRMDPKIYASFQKPLFVQTDKILFEKKRKLPANNHSKKLIKLEETKPKNVKHSFKFHESE